MALNSEEQKILRKKAIEAETVQEQREASSNPQSSRRILKKITPGTKFIGHFELLEIMQRGSMGIVYKARNRNDGSLAAIKEFISGEDIPEEDIERFKNEIKTTMMLDHPNIIKVITCGKTKSNHDWFAMEYLSGGTLLEWISEKDPTVKDVMQIIFKIANAVQYAHEKGIIHRDLKPGNAMITHDGEPMIMDFGLAKDNLSQRHLTINGTALGTYNYMPPEQAKGKIDQIDEKSDIYSIGAILYQLLTGIPPFVGKCEIDILNQILGEDPVPIYKINPEIDEAVQTITMKCLEKEKKYRYQSAAELAEDIELYLNNRKIKGKPPGKLRKASSRIRRNRPLFISILSLSISLFLIIAIYIDNMRHKATFRDLTAKLIQMTIKKEHENPDLLNLALKQERLKRFQTASDLYREIILSSKDQERVKRAEEALQRTLKKLGIAKNIKTYKKDFANIYPGVYTNLTLEDTNINAEIKDQQQQLFDLNKLIKFPINILNIDSKKLKDLSTLKYLPLKKLTLNNITKKDLDFLKESQLTKLTLRNMKNLADISAVKHMRITYMLINNTNISDISSLAGSNLTQLYINESPVSDISPLKDLKLKYLTLSKTKVSDLTALSSIPLNGLTASQSPIKTIAQLNYSRMRFLNISQTEIKDISALRNTIVKQLNISDTKIKDFSPIATLTLGKFDAANTALSDLSVIHKSKQLLRYLDISGTAIKDLSPLKEVSQLEILVLDRKQKEENQQLLKSLPAVKKILILSALGTKNNNKKQDI